LPEQSAVQGMHLPDASHAVPAAHVPQLTSVQPSETVPHDREPHGSASGTHSPLDVLVALSPPPELPVDGSSGKSRSDVLHPRAV
jgi:hypothetical protein